jgi:hypothetical protein
MKKRWIILGIVLILFILIIFGIYLFYKSYCEDNHKIQFTDSEIKNGIIDAFHDPNAKIVIFPSARNIDIQKESFDKGFSFSIRNKFNESSDFRYIIGVDPNFDIQEKCGISISEAESYLLIDSGLKKIPGNSIMEEPESIRLNIAKNAPLCIIIYKIDVMNNNTLYTSSKVYVNIIPKKNLFIRFKEYLENTFIEFIC